MKIAVCLPSFNEAQNIRKITQIVDQGLTDINVVYPNTQIEIINFDSNSTDNTANIFLETKTNNLKRSIILQDKAGKGKNILKFCKYAVDSDVDYCLTIDSDITSANPNWIIKLIQPLIENVADYVVPIYGRSRFEGSSTNHFAFPFVYALTGHSIRQPIAGDFAFTKKIASAISKRDLSGNESAQYYGIDVFMTVTAINVSNKIYQVDLGKKVHSPSFSKLEYMFPQIANSALLSVSCIDFPNKEIFKSETKSNIFNDLRFPHERVAREMNQSALNNLNNELSLDWVDSHLVAKYKDAFSKANVSEERMIDAWTNILSSWINHFLTSNLTPNLAKQAGEELLPFFVLRATNFWFWAKTTEVDRIEATIRKQAEILRSKIKKL